MSKIMEVKNLDYYLFNDIDINFLAQKYYLIVGGNKSGKTTLLNLLSGIILTEDNITCHKVTLNEDSRNQYIKKIGVVRKLSKTSFKHVNILDELLDPLLNLGYTRRKALERIHYLTEIFHFDKFLKKKINELNSKNKYLLLVIMALLHQPKVLLLDDTLSCFSSFERKEINNILSDLINKENITVINFSNDLEDVMFSNQIILLSQFNIIKKMKKEDIFENDKLFYENGIEVPFKYEIVNNLKIYKLIDQNYDDLKELVDAIWD